MHPSAEVTWLDSRDTVSLAELSQACGMSADELAELVDYGALEPMGSSVSGCIFSAGSIVRLRTVCKLRLDFDLDVFTAAILMGYLDRIDELERELRSLRVTTGSPRSHAERSEGHPS